MPNIHITLANSILSTTGSGDTQTGPGTYTVDAGAYVISNTAVSFEGAQLDGEWAVTINGAVIEVPNPGSGGAGIFIGGQTVSTTQTVTIGATGVVIGGAVGLHSEHSVNVVNKGTVWGDSVSSGMLIGQTNAGGLTDDKDYFVTNSGFIGRDALDTAPRNGLGLAASGGGRHTINNSGVIAGDTAAIYGGAGAEIVTNTGRLEGAVTLNGGNDNFTNLGVCLATIDLGSGNDTFTGGAGAQTVADGAGSDVYVLGDGNDVFRAAWGETIGSDTDIVKAGLGRDTYDASGAAFSVLINLDIIGHDLSPIDTVGALAANRATGSDLAGTSGVEQIFGFENAKGGSAGDALYGNAAANDLDGGGSGDNLFGYGGNDTLHGGSGADGIAGGAGADVLWGDAGNDVFQFFKLSDSGVAPAARDTIMDFVVGQDRIDLSFIDANTLTAATNDAFHATGSGATLGLAAFSGHGAASAGELRQTFAPAGTVLQGDVNGDGTADFAVLLKGVVMLNFNPGGSFLY